MNAEQRERAQRLVASLEARYGHFAESVAAASLLRELLAQDEADQKDLAYVMWRMQAILPLFQEARDALPAISEVSRRLHGVSSTLADRMDLAGTATREDFDAIAKEQK